MFEGIIEFIVRVLFEGMLLEGVGGLLRVTGALLRWPFHRGRIYIQVLRSGGNGWTGLLFWSIMLIMVIAA